MPSGQTHAAISAAAGLGLYYALGGGQHPEAIAACGGCLLGIIVTPDLDVDQPIRAHYVVGRRFGAPGFAAWRLLWLPYGLAIGHRSWVSHMPIISTLIRLGYLALVGWLLLAAVRMFGPFVGVLPPALHAPPSWGPWAVAGLALSDLLHWGADISWSWIKRKAKRNLKLRSADDGN